MSMLKMAEIYPFGFCAVYYEDNTFVRIPRRYFDSLKEYLIEGKRWFECENMYGAELMINLDYVEQIEDSTVHHLRAADEEKEREAITDG